MATTQPRLQSRDIGLKLLVLISLAAFLALLTLFMVADFSSPPSQKLTEYPKAITSKQLDQAYAFSIHPNGNDLFFVAQKEKVSYLYHKSREGKLKRIKSLGTARQNVQLIWSPDGSKLALGWQDGPSRVSLLSFDQSAMAVVNEESVSTDPKYDYSDIAWLDKTTLIVSRSILNQEQFHLYRLNLVTKEAELFHYHSYIGDPRFIRRVAAKESYVAYVQELNQTRTIHIISPRGDEIVHHTTSLQIHDIEFLPKLEGVILATDKGLKILSFYGGVQTLHVGLEGLLSHPQFDAMGKHLYLIQHKQNMDIWKRSIVTESLPSEPVSQSSKQDGQARCLADSDDFVFVSNRSGHSQLWRQTTRGVEQLTELVLDSEISHLHTSPDNKWVAFKSDEHVFLYDLTSGQLKPLLTDAPKVFPLGFDKSQNYLYYSNNFTTSNEFDMDYWRHNISSGKNEKLMIPPGRQAIVANGELYYLHPKDFFLYRWQQSGSEKIGSRFQRNTQFLTANRRFIYYTLPRNDQRKSVWAFNRAIEQHRMVIQGEQYQGSVSDICNDHMALIDFDTAPERNIVKIGLQLSPK